MDQLQQMAATAKSVRVAWDRSRRRSLNRRRSCRSLRSTAAARPGHRPVRSLLQHSDGLADGSVGRRFGLGQIADQHFLQGSHALPGSRCGEHHFGYPAPGDTEDRIDRNHPVGRTHPIGRPTTPAAVPGRNRRPANTHPMSARADRRRWWRARRHDGALRVYFFSIAPRGDEQIHAAVRYHPMNPVADLDRAQPHSTNGASRRSARYS